MPLKTIVLDLETVPNEAALDRLAAMRPEAPPTPLDGAAWPKWLLQRIVAACTLIIEEDAEQPTFEMKSWHTGSQAEASIITDIEHLLEGAHMLVTCNGRAHDLPVLRARALAARSLAVPRIAAMMAPKAVRHVDLLDELAGRGAARASLAEIAALLGLPAKAELAGTSVPALAAAGDLDRIVHHCESDVVATYLAHLHLSMSDAGSDQWVRSGAEGLAAWLEVEADRRPHLLAFREACECMARFEAVDAAPFGDPAFLDF